MGGDQVPNLRLVGVDGELLDSACEAIPNIGGFRAHPLGGAAVCAYSWRKWEKLTGHVWGVTPCAAVHTPIGRIDHEPASIWGLIDEMD